MSTPVITRTNAFLSACRIVEAKSPVDSPEQWDMTLKFWDEQKPAQETSIVINRSQRDRIRKKTRPGHASTPQPGTPPAAKSHSEPSHPLPATIGTPPSTHKSATNTDKNQDRTVDFTFIVMFAITLALICTLNAIVHLPLLIHTAIVSFISFIFGALTFAYTGPFKEWVNSFASKSKSKKE